jgi:hypothetical protein
MLESRQRWQVYLTSQLCNIGSCGRAVSEGWGNSEGGGGMQVPTLAEELQGKRGRWPS